MIRRGNSPHSVAITNVPIHSQLNSVRTLPEYKGSVDPQDLLDLYVGNTHYRAINKALRSPDINTARQQVWDEADLMKPKVGYPGVSDEYMQKFKGYENTIPTSIEDARIDAQDVLEFSNNLNQTGRFFKRHPLAYSPGFSDLPIGEQARQIIDYQLPEKTLLHPSIEDRQKAESYFQQTLASIPHIEKVVMNQPVHELEKVVAVTKTNLPDKIDKAFNNYFKKYERGNHEVDYETYLAIENSLMPDKQKQLGLIDDNFNYIPKNVYDYISSLRTVQTTAKMPNPPISRGLHFKEQADYDNFINQHKIGEVVEYPAFTSTTILPNIQAGFSAKRAEEIPVFQDFKLPKDKTHYNAYDVDNPKEGERLYPPGQRFKVLSNDGRNISLQETNELTPVEQRTQGILGRLKPSYSQPKPEASQLLDQHLQMAKPKREAEFVQLADGNYQSYVDGKPYKLLTEAEALQAVDKLKYDDNWGLSWKYYHG